MTTRWEYFTLSFSTRYGKTDYYVNGNKEPRLKDRPYNEVFNLFGAQGWEMVGIAGAEGNMFAFKRPTPANGKNMPTTLPEAAPDVTEDAQEQA